jgi:hypothetical protein
MALDPRDYKLDVSGVPQPDATSTLKDRPFLSVQFDCCSVYQRVYRDPDGSSYRGRCPRCGKGVTFAVGEGGTSSRFFVVR